MKFYILFFKYRDQPQLYVRTIVFLPSYETAYFYDIPTSIKNLHKRCTIRFLEGLSSVYNMHDEVHNRGENITDYIKPYINYRSADKIIMTRIYNIEDGSRIIV